MLARTALIGLAMLTSAASAEPIYSPFAEPVYRPYWIEESCDRCNTNCDPRMRYERGQYPMVVDPNGYWYGIPEELRRNGHWASYDRHHRSNSRHVAWCKDRYRTYNPRTDLFVGKGYRHMRCNSPYDGRA